MESDEDEDVIFKGSQLHSYLVSSEYEGPEINYYNTGKIAHDSILLHQSDEKLGLWSLRWLFSTISSQFGLKENKHEEIFARDIIHSIIDTALVSVEDADFLLNIFEDNMHNVILETSLDGYFKFTAIGGIAFAATLFSSTIRVPWILRTPSLLYTGVNILRAIGWKLSDLRKQKFDRIVTRFKSSLELLYGLCLTLNKSIQFIQEMELIDRGFTLPNLVTHLSIKTLPSQPSALLCMPLRREVMETVRELHQFVRTSTLHIREALPLSNAVDSASHYVACADFVPSGDAETITLQTIRASMRQCHVQLSEMLRRLSLCFLQPVSDRHVHLVNQLNENLPQRIVPLSERLQTAYDYYTAWKVAEPCDISPGVVSLHVQSRGLDLALHSLERHLRATALLVSAVRESELLPATRVQLSQECKAVATCWELVEFELERMSGRSVPVAPAEPRRVFEPVDRETLPLYGNWEPDVQDEILEADLEQELSCVAADDDDDFMMLLRETREERLARKQELAAQSKRLYSELQLVLRSKAAEWKEREARVMERLGKTVEQEEPQPSEECVATEPECDGLGSDNNRPQFDSTIVPSSTFGIQASLAAQVRAMASQRVQQEDVIGDSDDSTDE